MKGRTLGLKRLSVEGCLLLLLLLLFLLALLMLLLSMLLWLSLLAVVLQRCWLALLFFAEPFAELCRLLNPSPRAGTSADLRCTSCTDCTPVL